MSTDPRLAQEQAGEDGRYSVDARDATAVLVGDGNTQIIYSYAPQTWTDGVPPPPLVGVSGAVDSPYRGLSAFEERDAAFFFGREAAATKILERLSGQREGAGLLMVSGVSGAGKSSLLRAGVLPRLRGAGLARAPGSAMWPCLVFTPTHAPLNELATLVASLAGTDAAEVRRGLDDDPAGFALTARQAAAAQQSGPLDEPDLQERRLLLVVDQFEQVFTQCASESQRKAFIAALHAAATTGHGAGQAPAALVVLVVRADFEARCAEYPQLAPAVQDRYLVTAMSERQLRLAITEPAKKIGFAVDEGLVEALLRDIRSRLPATSAAGSRLTMVPRAGVLPLLSHALDQAWRNRTGDVLGLADYERIGGVEGGVAASAQRAYDRLTPGQQSAAKQIFMRLIVTSPDGVDSADRAARADLEREKSQAAVRDIDAVLEAFAAERLLTLGADTVEISHEVLLTAWEQLRGWLDSDQYDRVLCSQLINDARTWDGHARAPSFLYQAGRLTVIDAAAARWENAPTRYQPLLAIGEAFLQASRSAARRAVLRRRMVIGGLLALTLIAVTAAGVAARNVTDAARQHAIALSRQLAAESLLIESADPVIARRLAVAAWHEFPTSQAGSVITALLAQQQQNGILPADTAGLRGVAFSPDGELLASAGLDGTVRLWNPVTGRPAGTPLRADSGTSGGVYGVAFSPSGRLLASADADGSVRLWNPVTGHPIGDPLHADRNSNDLESGVNGVAFSPDGKLLASADGEYGVRLWNPATGQPIGVPLKHNWAQGVAFSPDGKLLASADVDGTVRLWNPVDGRPVGKPIAADLGPAGGVNGVAFSPDGKLLASADEDGTVRLWNPVTGQPVGKPLQADRGTLGGVRGVAFSPDGKLLASANEDGTAQLWIPATDEPIGAPLPAASSSSSITSANSNTVVAGVTGVAFSPDGKLLASAGAGGIVRLWDPVTGQPVGKPLRAATGTLGGVYGVAFSPDGKLLASADGDGTVRLWNPVTGQPVGRPLRAGTHSVYAVAFSPDGKLLASAGEDGIVRLWDPVTGHRAGKPLPANVGFLSGVNGVAFSPNGRLLASADTDGTVRLWNPVTGRPAGAPLRADPGALGGVDGVAFSRDGKLLASADGDGTVRLWNPVTGRPAGAPLADPGTSGGVDGVAFSPDAMLLAIADADGTLGLWNPVTGQPVGKPLPADAGGPFGGVNGVAFSRDGKLLASADADGTVRSWRVWLFADPYAALCADVGLPTQQEWAQYAPGERQPSACS